MVASYFVQTSYSEEDQWQQLKALAKVNIDLLTAFATKQVTFLGSFRAAVWSEFRLH